MHFSKPFKDLIARGFDRSSPPCCLGRSKNGACAASQKQTVAPSAADPTRVSDARREAALKVAAQLEEGAAKEAELEGRLRALRQRVAALKAEAAGAKSAGAAVQARLLACGPGGVVRGRQLAGPTACSPRSLLARTGGAHPWSHRPKPPPPPHEPPAPWVKPPPPSSKGPGGGRRPTPFPSH